MAFTGEHATALLLAVALAAAGWLLVRRRLARRRRAVAAWLAGGVEVFGGAAASRWTGPRRLQVRIDQAAPPFRGLGLAVNLARLGLARSGVRLAGRALAPGDLLVVRSELTRPPRAEFDFFYPDCPSGREALEEAAGARWRVSEVGDPSRYGVGALRLAEPGGPRVAPRDGLLAVGRRVEELSAEVRRVAVRRRAPHLVAVVAAPGATGEVTAQALFDLLREAAFLALGPAAAARDPAPAS